jgi:hypothetical protein
MNLTVDLVLILWLSDQLVLPEEVQRSLFVLAVPWTRVLAPALDLLYFQMFGRLSLVFEQFRLLSP